MYADFLNKLFTESGCFEDQVNRLANGQAYRMLDGAVYKYKCKEGYSLAGYGSVFCDGVRWSHDKPECEGRYAHRLVQFIDFILQNASTSLYQRNPFLLLFCHLAQ